MKPYIQQAISSFYQSTKHESPPLSFTKHDKMLIKLTALGFDLCVLYYRSPRTLREKRVILSVLQWLCLGRRADGECGVSHAAAVGDVVGVGEGRRLHLLTRVLHRVPQLEVDLLLLNRSRTLVF
jgi:hypothetical protein